MNNYNPIIIELLRQRGITQEADVMEFLSEKPQKFYDPFLLLGMKAGVDLIVSGLKKNKKICIYGDYDADGITATTLMMDALTTVTDNLTYYIPSRFEEGYGLNMDAIDLIHKEGCQLLITVDCGSVSYDEVEYAKSLGMDVVVTDHHSLNEHPADCILINPKQKECKYPFKELAGCGVAFKVIQALVKENVIDRQILTKSLDLVAIGTIGDVVPLIDENRTFAKYGIRSINMGLRPGLNHLIGKILSRQNSINSDNISYGIVPHLNASGRMEDASIAVELLRTNVEKVGRAESIEDISYKIIENNILRKKTQGLAYEQCKDMVEKHHKDDKFIIIRADGIHEGIAGIVAGKVKEHYDKPTIILTKSGDYLKGTGRSIEGLNLYQLLGGVSDLFIRFGGHAGACGFTMEEDKLPFLRERLQKAMETITHAECDCSSKWDMTVEMDQIDNELASQLELLAPFGNKNPKPVFRIENVAIDKARAMGDRDQHVRFSCVKNHMTLQCVLFNKASEYFNAFAADHVNLVGTIEVQHWNGNSKLQFIIEEIEY